MSIWGPLAGRYETERPRKLLALDGTLAKAEPIDSKPGRYRPPDPLLRFLESL